MRISTFWFIEKCISEYVSIIFIMDNKKLFLSFLKENWQDSLITFVFGLRYITIEENDTFLPKFFS
jgi:hypothetical protein